MLDDCLAPTLLNDHVPVFGILQNDKRYDHNSLNISQNLRRAYLVIQSSISIMPEILARSNTD